MIITLIDGQQVDSAYLSFDPATYHVIFKNWDSGGVSPTLIDVTDNMRQNDKVALFPNFDRAQDNVRSYNEATIAAGGTPVQEGSTSTLGIFWDQITTDPLAAPLESLSNAASSVWQNPVGKTVTVVVGLVLVLYAVNTFAKLSGK